MLDICDNVLFILDSDGETDEVCSDSCFNKLLVGKLTVGGGCRVENAGSCVGNVGNYCGELQAIHELGSRLSTALDTEGDNSAGTVGHILLRQCVVLIGLKRGIIYPCYLIICLKELSYCGSVFYVARYIASLL